MITFHVEPLTSCWEEVRSLTAKHFEEINRPYRPSFSRYKEYEDAGNLFVVTVRDSGLVGFAMMYVFQSMHDQEIGAQEDLFYLLPEYRKGWNALRVLSLVEEECHKRGCKEINMTAESGSQAGSILLARKYVSVGLHYRKSLVRADSPSILEAVK